VFVIESEYENRPQVSTQVNNSFQMIHYSVFISSTIDDLWAERDRVDEELRATEIFDPIRVENLPAIGEASRYVCLKEVADADAVIIILKDRYGFIPDANNPEGLSVTHLEYREAKRLEKPIFAFLHDGVEAEPVLQQFIREINDFDQGVLRKKWKSVDQLKSEVRRALLFWIARRARGDRSREAREKAIQQLVRYPELAEFPLVQDTVAAVDNDLRNWSNDYFKHLSQQCRRRLLPLPRPIDKLVRASLLPNLILRVERSPRNDRLAITLSLNGSKEFEKNKREVPPPMEIDAAETSEGAQFVAQASIALVFIAVDDWFHSIDQLFVVAGSRNASNTSKARLIGTAAYVSAYHRGERSFEIAQQMLGLPSLDRSCVNAGIMCLMAAEARFEHARARHALAESERLVMRLLISALNQHEGSSENIYNLARQSLKHSHKAALTFYGQLLRTDPSYDERWYFHRDIGFIHYAAGHYREAARHYDLACHLKGNDSEVFRFAGDAYYYQGYRSEALIRYEKAVEIEPTEIYFLDAKIEFAENRIHQRMERSQRFVFLRSLGHLLSRVGVRAAESRMKRVARSLFSIAKHLCDLNFNADTWLALYANRRGFYEEAITHLKAALATIPEDPSTRLNLVVNLIFQSKGNFNETARVNAKIAIFHGGPEARDRFRLRLANTRNREELCEQFNEIFNIVKNEREERVRRRQEVLKPQVFGDVIHFELRP
jgi:tetratricopeptide (TPR) repeat protein